MPVGIVLGRIQVDGLACPAMDGQISLSVAIEVKRSQFNAADNRLFEDSGRDDAALPDHFSWKAYVDGNEFHGSHVRSTSGSRPPRYVLDQRHPRLHPRSARRLQA